MHVDNNVTTIDAKKSWFMFDDEMVALEREYPQMTTALWKRQ